MHSSIHHITFTFSCSFAYSFSFSLSFYFSNTYAHCISFTHSNTHTHLISFLNSSLWSHSLHNVFFILNSHHAYASLHLYPHISVYSKEQLHNIWIQYTYNMQHSISKLYHIHAMHIHLASTSMSVKRTIFVRSNSKCSKYSALNIETIYQHQ